MHVLSKKTQTNKSNNDNKMFKLASGSERGLIKMAANFNGFYFIEKNRNFCLSSTIDG